MSVVSGFPSSKVPSPTRKVSPASEPRTVSRSLPPVPNRIASEVTPEPSRSVTVTVSEPVPVSIEIRSTPTELRVALPV